MTSRKYKNHTAAQLDEVQDLNNSAVFNIVKSPKAVKKKITSPISKRNGNGSSIEVKS